MMNNALNIQYEIEIPAGYKTTEVGVIPEDWKISEIGTLISDMRGGAPFKPSDFTKEGIMVLPKGAVVRGGVLKLSESDQQFCTPEFAAKFSKNSVTEVFTIVVLRDLVPSGPSIGLMVKIPEPAFYILAQGVYGFITSKRLIENYLIHYSNTFNYRRAVNEVMVGSTQVHITNDAFKSLKIPLPIIAEQIAIARVLSDTDVLIASLEQLIAKKKAIKTATIQQLLTGRSRLPQFSKQQDGSAKTYKNSELGFIPDNWEVIKLGKIANFLKGSGLPKSALCDDGEYSCIHYGQLFTFYGPQIKKAKSKTNFNGSIKSEKNDVLMPTSDVTPNGLATASCITESGVTLGGDILIIRVDEKILNGIYFSYLVTIMRDQVMQLVTGSTVYHLYGSDMAKFCFAIPPENEQTAIATVLSDMDAELTALERKLAKFRDIKQGMMQQLLTGRIRLPLEQQP